MSHELLSQEDQKLQFIVGWTVHISETPKAQIDEELASLAMETKGIPDNYSFFKRYGRLVSPKTGRPVRESIKRGAAVDIAEDNYFSKFEHWSMQSDCGVALWISPPHPERTPRTKITISENTENGVTNRAILLNVSWEDSIHIGNRLIMESINPLDQTENPEVLREMLIVLAKPKEWIDTLERALGPLDCFRQIRHDIDIQKKMIALKQAKKYTTMMEIGIPPSHIAGEMERDKYLGQLAGSCGPMEVPTVSSLMESHSLIYNEMGKFVKNCGACGTPINTVISRGYRCPRCGGIYEGC